MRILSEHSAALIIDVQEKLLPHIQKHEKLQKNLEILIHGLKALQVPIIVSEQYPKGLGSTLKELDQVLGDYTPMIKNSFSCYDENCLKDQFSSLDKKYIIITGIESHICVLQTAIDLIGHGYIPVVVEDCVSSRRENDKKIAIERMRQEGAIITTYESLLFELCRYSGTDVFKVISKLIK